MTRDSPRPTGRSTAEFGHPPALITFWRRLVRTALGHRVSTPFYVFAAAPIAAAFDELRRVEQLVPVPTRHWLSCKTQPLLALLAWWRRQGRPIEVVSEFELLAARRAGFAPRDILVNGPAKHHWLPGHPLRGLRVNFDSRAELAALVPLARALDWSVGVRCLTDEEHDPEQPTAPTQFGLAPDEAVKALRWLRQAGLRLETLHFHLRTNVASAAVYGHALAEVAAVCRAAAFAPRHLDVGGGLPPPCVRDRQGQFLDARFDLAALGRVYARGLDAFPGLRELWMENGRFVLARGGVLVTRVLEVKCRRGVRQLVCDGGRTLNALVSLWEQHGLFWLPARAGRRVETSVYGPTCMAFDQLARRPLPRSLRAGDHLIWLDAGAYHLPWETRFSHGLASVFWHDGKGVTAVRMREDFVAWWGQWR